MLLELEVLRKQLSNIAALLSAEPLILENAGNIRHSEGRSRHEKKGRCSIVLGSLGQAGAEGGQHWDGQGGQRMSMGEKAGNRAAYSW